MNAMKVRMQCVVAEANRVTNAITLETTDLVVCEFVVDAQKVIDLGPRLTLDFVKGTEPQIWDVVDITIEPVKQVN